ncbi:MAG: hypothetical protein U0K91_02235 [Acutalibacteraceae bacterium]|nr:hypothetical protein [Acutalibacteraceae bacterium]
MSGGHFEYRDSALKIEMFGWADKPHNVLEDRELSELAWDLLDVIHEYDWYKSGDTCKKTYLEAKDKLKKKWLSNRGINVRRIIDESVNDLKSELYETFVRSDNNEKP